ncbi:uncharacterized protein LOC129595565 [Paramacrobiotus metropolitanus]|uniref:uncharacterized protein LOC129595565 n=1 Tax=Paramacrobiotus metropolitanus TaxID=2943436 RepID=UPI00244572BC|nr:uncharacterized protein LOC129595565 [Paramacrobiotus metropolitanus]XP_055348597.1 uncharacterized protein LOC129595565 [Paramacrobiotus metropolitanus]
MDGKRMKKGFDVAGNGFTIRHSTEHHLDLDGRISLHFPRQVRIINAQHPDRLNEQRLLETGLLQLLAHYQLANMESGATDDGAVLCRAMYTFQKALQDLHSAMWNHYGQGKLQRVRVSRTGHEISPLPAWLENGVGLQVFLQEKVATNRRHSSEDESKRGFEIPWQARIQLERLPDECILTEVQLAFINPDHRGSPIVHIEMAATHATNMDFINNTLKNINGQTYSECCQELGIFREAYCFVTMRVPLRRFLGQLFSKFRQTIPECPALAKGGVMEGTDTVVLNTRQGKIEMDRQILASVSPKARAIFAEGEMGKVGSYGLDCSLAVVATVLDAAVNKNESLPVDPRRAAPFFLYEVMKLALIWEIPQLKLWTQVAFVERLCHPVVNLEQIPVLDAVRAIYRHAEPKEVGSRMILCGLFSLLRILHSSGASWTMDELQQVIAPKPALWKNFLQPTRLLPDTTIFVKTLTGKTLTVPVNLAYWVYPVKCWIQNKEGIPMDQQRLIFEGTQLIDNVTLLDCGMTAQATVHLVLRLSERMLKMEGRTGIESM